MKVGHTGTLDPFCYWANDYRTERNAAAETFTKLDKWYEAEIIPKGLE